MVAHIQHLADYWFIHGSEHTMSQLNNYQSASLKWDGVGVVAGYDTGIFVSSKSYFNKTPVKFYSKTEIYDSVMPDALKLKLTDILHYLQIDNEIQPGQINQGDFLFNNFEKRNIPTQKELMYQERICQPNIIEYTLTGDLNYRYTGVVWHTDLSGNGLISSKSIYSPNNIVELDSFDFKPEKVWNSNSEMVKYIWLPYLKYIYDNQHKSVNKYTFNVWYTLEVEKQVNKYKTERKQNETRELYAQLYLLVEPSEFGQFSKQISFIDEYIRQQLKKVSGNSCKFIRKDGVKENTHHEGIVVTLANGDLVKIVDRYQFSRINRGNDYIRGWELDK